jgi:hypothetical protein
MMSLFLPNQKFGVGCYSGLGQLKVEVDFVPLYTTAETAVCAQDSDFVYQAKLACDLFDPLICVNLTDRQNVLFFFFLEKIVDCCDSQPEPISESYAVFSLIKLHYCHAK